MSADARQIAIRAARAQGCTCNVEVIGSGLEFTLRHDAWCPLLRVMEERGPGPARSQLVIAPRRQGTS
jgi:hypothetical protein